MGAKIYYLELIFIFVSVFEQQKLMKRDILTETLFLRKNDKKHQKKKSGCKFIRINTSNTKNGYNLDYEVGNVQAFIDEFKNKKIKKPENKTKELKAKLKELEDKNKNLITNQITNNFKKIIIKN